MRKSRDGKYSSSGTHRRDRLLEPTVGGEQISSASTCFVCSPRSHPPKRGPYFTGAHCHLQNLVGVHKDSIAAQKRSAHAIYNVEFFQTPTKSTYSKGSIFEEMAGRR